LSRLTLALGLGLLVVEASVGAFIVGTSSHSSDNAVSLGLAVLGGAAFVISGLIAIARRPENRTGVYLAAVGYLWFLGALSSANNPWLFTIGSMVGGLAFGPLTALALVHPTGRFGSRFEAAVPWAVVFVVVAFPTAIVLVDPTPDPTCDDCPENKLNVVDADALGDALLTIFTIAGIVAVMLVGVLMARRWRSATPALRRLLRPVFIALAAFLASLLLDSLISELVSESASRALAPLFFATFIAVPLSFLYGILRTRLARSSVAELMTALDRGASLRDALAQALGDPTLEISYRPAGTDRWVDADGRSVPEPVPALGRAQTTIDHAGLPIAVLDYDAHLAEERELVDGVAAAASLLVQNERLYAGLRSQYAFLETMTDTAPSLLVNVDLQGRILNQNRAAVAVTGIGDEELIRGRYFWDVFIDPRERQDVIERFRELAPDFAPAEYENTFTNERGEERVVYWRAAPVHDEEGNVLSIVAGGLDITDRVRIAEEKERERAFLNAIANHAPSLLALVDHEGRLAPLATNLAFERTLEVSTEEAGGHLFWERYVAPDEAAEVEQRIRRVVAGEALGEHDNRWVTTSGRELQIAWTCTPLPQIDERRLFLLSGVDVTERKDRELELERERDVQTTVFETMPSMMVVLGLDGTIRDRNADDPAVGANRAFQDLIRWPARELVGRSFLDLVVEDDDGRAARAIATAASGDTSQEVESELRSADGTARAFSWSAIPVADVTGRMERLILVCGVDVTERRRREEEIRAGEERFRAVIESAPVAITEIGLDDTVRLWNRAAERIFGWSANEVLGQPPVWVPEDMHGEYRELSDLEAAGEGYTGFETTRLHRDGRRLEVEIAAAPIHDADGEVVGAMAVLNDISDRKRHEEEIRASRARIVRAADEARRGLERNLHDGAQQRLVALSVALRLIESKLRDDPEGASALLAGAREELAHALEELRELARGIHPAILTDQGLKPALEALTRRAPIPIELEAPSERLAPAVEAAAYYVVAESLTNMAKHGGASSARVSLGTFNGTLTVTVADDGVGGADPDRGSGLRGLADRVEALEGRLVVESPRGEGTTIRAEIPLHPVRPTPG
jgi:PAS domain S-box-containing protein